MKTAFPLLVAGLLTCSTPLQADPPHKNILLIGDSETVYAELYMHDANVKQSNETVYFDAKPGTTIGYWNGIFASELAKYPNIDEVIIFLGTNNWNATRLPPLNNILAEVNRRHLKCLWVGPTAVLNHPHPINRLLKPAVVPTCSYFDTEQAGIELRDIAHPTRAGAIKWLKMIWSAK